MFYLFMNMMELLLPMMSLFFELITFLLKMFDSASEMMDLCLVLIIIAKSFVKFAFNTMLVLLETV